MAHDHSENEIRNYNRNTVSYEGLQNTQVARQEYLNYERDKELPDVEEIEADWLAVRKRLYRALECLTSRQREVLILIAVKGLNEYEVACKLGLNQSTVSRHFHAAKKQIKKSMNK